MSTRAINVLFVIAATVLTAFVLSASHLLDNNSDEHAKAIAMKAKIKADEAKERLAKAAQKMCGENGAWKLIDSQTLQCFTHRGARTITAKVSP